MNHPKSAALKLIEGNPGKRPINESEPKPNRIMPKPVFSLSDVGKKFWKKYTLIALKMGTLTEADAPAFTQLCQYWGEDIELSKKIEEEGRTFIKVSVDGAGVEHEEKKSNPLVKQRAEVRKEIRQYLQLFGFTPRSRPGIKASFPLKKEEGLEGLLT